MAGGWWLGRALTWECGTNGASPWMRTAASMNARRVMWHRSLPPRMCTASWQATTAACTPRRRSVPERGGHRPHLEPPGGAAMYRIKV